ncbi:hypothetical protein Fmac_029112 [Flemingia macrophylla]|uniref:Uncharacterized protein n=1 Tax=Flemingia macrophylla TaxID=520843 RepID=A0ABD1L9E7_9FABA
MVVSRFSRIVDLIRYLTTLPQVGLWVFGGLLNIDVVSAAILGLAVLLVTGVVTWKECLAEGVAWDTLTWFATLIAMVGYLNKYGLISWFSQTVVKRNESTGNIPGKISEKPCFNLNTRRPCRNKFKRQHNAFHEARHR